MSEITNQPLYLIKFDDTEVPDETMFGADVAKKRFEQISGNWNAHLFVKVASNSRDDSCSGSNAKLASDYDALAAQRDEAVAAHEALGKVYAFTQLGFEKMMAQRDEGLAREAELFDALDECDGDRHRLRDKVNALKQRLAEAEKHLSLMVEEAEGLRGELDGAWAYAGSTAEPARPSSDWVTAKAFLASPGCADGEKVNDAGRHQEEVP